jgi:hypothetical protein
LGKFFASISGDTWVLAASAIIGSFLAGFFAIYVMNRQIVHNKKTKVVEEMESLIKYYYNAKIDLTKCKFELTMLIGIITKKQYTHETSAKIQMGTGTVDVLLNSLRENFPKTLPAHIYEKINYTFRLIEMLNDNAKDFIVVNESMTDITISNMTDFMTEFIDILNFLDEFVEDVSAKRRKIKL